MGLLASPAFGNGEAFSRDGRGFEMRQETSYVPFSEWDNRAEGDEENREQGRFESDARGGEGRQFGGDGSAGKPADDVGGIPPGVRRRDAEAGQRRDAEQPAGRVDFLGVVLERDQQ